MGFGELLKDIATILTEANKFDNNKQQQYFLKELKKISNKISKQEKTQKKHLILGIIVSSIASGLLGYLLTDDGRENLLILINYEPEDRVHDDFIYKSYSGGFYMIKPDPSWAFGPIDSSLKRITDSKMWESKYFIDGQILENSATTVDVIVFVYSKEYIQSVDIENTFKNISEQINSERVVLSDEIRSSINGDWFEKESIHLLNDRQQLEKVKIQVYNDKFYYYQGVLWDPDTASDKDRKDFESAWNSFKFCSSRVNCND